MFHGVYYEVCNSTVQSAHVKVNTLCVLLNLFKLVDHKLKKSLANLLTLLNWRF